MMDMIKYYQSNSSNIKYDKRSYINNKYYNNYNDE